MPSRRCPDHTEATIRTHHDPTSPPQNATRLRGPRLRRRRHRSECLPGTTTHRATASGATSWARGALLALLLVLWSGTTGCGSTEDASSPPDQSDRDATQTPATGTHDADASRSEAPSSSGHGSPVPFAVEVLGTREHAFNEGTRTFTKLRLTRSDGAPTYALWVPPNTVPGPAVLSTHPYDAVDWTGDPVDERWAERIANSPGGTCDDVDGPGWEEGVSERIPCALTPFPQLAEGANAWLLNDVGVLMVFGRFHAGSALDGHVRDVTAGLAFLAGEDSADNTRIGITGGSWGGFMALYGAASLPNGIESVATVAYYPPVDFPRFVRWIEQELPDLLAPLGRRDLLAFFEPYLRRIQAAEDRVHGPAMDFTDEWVCRQLQGETFIVHDEHDTLVPYGPVREFAEECAPVSGAWYRRPTPIDWSSTPLWHGPIGEDPVFPAMFTLGIAWMLDRLHEPDAPRLVLHVEANLRTLLRNARDSELRGEDVRWVTHALMPLTAASLQLVDFTDPGAPRLAPGASVLADLLADIWDEEVTASSVRGWLQRFLLP